MDKASEFTKENNISGLDCQASISSGVLSRAERTPGEVAVSGIYGRELAGGKLPAGFPSTNSELPFIEGGSFIDQPGTSPGAPPWGILYLRDASLA